MEVIHRKISSLLQLMAPEEGMTWEEWLNSEYSLFERFATTTPCPQVFLDGQWFEIMLLKGKFEIQVSASSIISSGSNYILIEASIDLG